jgi:heme-degrading monooxygenase HmoA
MIRASFKYATRRYTMHADIVTIPIQPSKEEEGERFIREVSSVVFRQQQGFKTSFVLRGSDPNKLVLFSLWEEKANSDAWVNSEAYQEYRGKAAGLMAGPPAVDSYEVVWHECCSYYSIAMVLSV